MSHKVSSVCFLSSLYLVSPPLWMLWELRRAAIKASKEDARKPRGLTELRRLGEEMAHGTCLTVADYLRLTRGNVKLPCLRDPERIIRHGGRILIPLTEASTVNPDSSAPSQLAAAPEDIRILVNEARHLRIEAELVRGQRIAGEEVSGLEFSGPVVGPFCMNPYDLLVLGRLAHNPIALSSWIEQAIRERESKQQMKTPPAAARRYPRVWGS